MTTSPPPSPDTNGGSASSLKVHNDNMRDDIHKTVDDARHGAAGRVEGVADSIDAAATHLDDEDMTRLSGYVHDMAQSLTGFARDMRDKSGDDVLHDVKRMARNNPALFLGGSVAIGFGLSRFARATRKRERQLPVPMDQARVHVAPTPGSTSSEAHDYGELP